MRFVWITKESPLEADSGGRLYSNGLIRSLLRTGATGTLVSYAMCDAAPASVPGLSLLLASPTRQLRALSLLSSLQSDAFRLKGAEITSLLRRALQERPDAIIVDYFAMGWVLPIINTAFHDTLMAPALIYITHNYEPAVRREVAASVKNPIMRQILKLDAEKAARLDLQMLNAAHLVVVNTDEDKQAYRKHVFDKPIVTLTPAYDGEITPTRPIDDTLPRRAVITGAFDWIAKQLTLRRFLAAADKPFSRAGISLLVVGRAPQPFIRELSEKYSFCTFTGKVDDVRPYLPDARIGIMPDDVGGGFKHKYLYYIFAGLPVATIRSQFAGMPVDIDRDVIAGDNVEELAHAVVTYIDDIPRLEGMRQRCWEACARSFNWDERGQRLRAEIEKILSTRAKPQSPILYVAHG